MKQLKISISTLHLDDLVHLLPVRMEAGVGEALPLVLPEKPTVPKDDVVDLVA